MPEEKVIDQINDEQILTWDEAAAIQTKRVFLSKYGKYVIYRDRIPLDKMAEIQARYSGKSAQDVQGRLMEILQYVMISPSISTPEAKRSVLKSDSAMLLNIINDVVSSEDGKDIKDSLAGNSPASA